LNALVSILPDLHANFLRSYFSKANSDLFPLGDKNVWHGGKLEEKQKRLL